MKEKIETMLGAVLLLCQCRPASAIAVGVLFGVVVLLWTANTGEPLPFID